jgi:ammonia channel protein AmtB
MSSFDPGIVHLTGGVAGLTGTIILKPRKGRFENPEEFEAHNLPFVVSPGST